MQIPLAAFVLAAVLPAVPVQAELTYSLPALVARAKPAVVTVLAYDPDKALPSLGTGFFVAPGRLLSVRHLFAGATRAEVRTVGGETLPVAGLLAEELAWDLALVAVTTPAPSGEVLPLATALPAEGERVVTLGCPFGFEWSVSEGLVSALRELPETGVLLQHTAAVSLGSSGCPLLNLHGEVVGMQAAVTTGEKVLSAGQQLNFAVPCDRLVALKPGNLRALAECAQEVPAGWQPPLLGGVDRAGLRFLTRDDFQAATAFFQDAVKRTPNEADAWFRLGLCHEKCGEADKAVAAYKQALELDPNLAVACNNLGVVYLQQGRTADAVEALSAAVRLKPDYTLAHGTLAEALVKVERYEEAAAEAKRAIAADSKLAAAHYHLGVALFHLGNRDGARREQEFLLGFDRGFAERLGALLGSAPARRQERQHEHDVDAPGE